MHYINIKNYVFVGTFLKLGILSYFHKLNTIDKHSELTRTNIYSLAKPEEILPDHIWAIHFFLLLFPSQEKCYN